MEGGGEERKRERSGRDDTRGGRLLLGGDAEGRTCGRDGGMEERCEGEWRGMEGGGEGGGKRQMSLYRAALMR